MVGDARRVQFCPETDKGTDGFNLYQLPQVTLERVILLHTASSPVGWDWSNGT